MDNGHGGGMVGGRGQKDGGSCSAVIKTRKAGGRWMMGAKGMACTSKWSHGIVASTNKLHTIVS